MKPAQVVKALAALAQPTRLAIYRLLVTSGPEGLAAGQIAEKLKVSPANMSFHFKTLAKGLVVYGAKVVRPNTLGVLYADYTAEAS